MAGVSTKNVVILMDQYNLTADMNSVEFPDELEAVEDTRFGDAAHKYYPGLDDTTLSLAGYWQSGVGKIDELLNAALMSATKPIISVLWEGATVGKAAHIAQFDETKYDITAQVGGSVELSSEFQGSDGKQYGVVLRDLTPVTATGNGTGVNNGASTAFGWVAHQHVITVSGTSPTLDTVLEHSADNVTYVGLSGGTFSQATAPTKQRLEGTGTVNQYVRVRRTVGGTGSPSFVAPVTFARKYR